MPYGASSWERLVDLAPNPLTGLAIGDNSRFYVDIPAEDYLAVPTPAGP